MLLELRHGAEEFLVFVVGAEAHDALDAGAVVPAAVEQHDLAGGRQVRDVALEVPLRALALVRRGQRRDAADARVEPLGDALDHAALAGGVAALEQDDDLVASVCDDPVLQLDQLALQAEQLAEILSPRHLCGVFFGLCLGDLPFGQHAILDFHFQFLVETVDHVRVDALEEFAIVFGSFHGVHWPIKW